MADSDITKMKVADLKKELKLRNLPTTGNKNELTERLQAALLDGDTTLDDAVLNSDDILDDDVLNDDELDDDDVDDKSLLNDKSLEDVVLQTPPETKTIVSAAATDAIPAQKKVVLKRKLIAPEPDATNIASSTPTVGSPKIDASAAADVASAVSLNTSATSLKDGDQTSGATPTKVPKIPITAPSDDDGIVIKNRAAESAAKDNNGKADATATGKDIVKLAEVTVLSYEERMALRAKRFGIPAAGAATPADKKPATVPTAAAAAAVAAKPSAAVASLADSEQLKKRAERFGLTVADESAKLAARAERFGTAAAANNKTATTTTTVPAAAASGGAAKKAASSLNDPELVEQMRKRAERFGGSVSKVMLQIENEEKLRERQERFNASAAASAAKVAATAPATVTTTAPAVEVAATAVADKTE